ncbi:hypothetical protein [Aquimarina sp. 2201CG14-23]|uniref:hypothetical protein n=1 Tax=Aquimarina mycalae TaxID=3040073 RepID=UPI002477FBE1|nr:hypothetical protein [Aquimarina sp. 2201CG14-23]MDH7444849.1 hypothetical protein [Aquimarina sp. 2201CG14-23]
MDKKDKILDRVIVFAAHLGISLRSFSLSIGASAGYLHRLQSANSNIGGDFIEKIIQLYTELNPTWLVTGEGDMIKEGYRVEENGIYYGGKDYFKQALLNYLDDKEVQDKLLQTVNKDQSDSN